MVKIIALILMLIPLCAKAESTYLYTETSAAGESMDAFVVRIARSIEMEGQRKNAEVCGAIKSFDGRYSLSLSYKQDNIQCTVSHGQGDVLIHTHLPYMGARFSPADYSHKGYMVRNGVICYNDGAEGTEAIVSRTGRKPGSKCAKS